MRIVVAQQQPRPRVLEHHRQTRGRIAGIERQIRRAGLQHRKYRGDAERRAFGRQRNHVIRLHATRDQSGGELLRVFRERRVVPAAGAAAHCLRVRLHAAARG